MLDIRHAEAATLRDFNLPEAAPRIVVAGAYEGATVAFIREHHPSARILACEPQSFAYDKLVKRFYRDDFVTLSNYALGATDTLQEVTLYEYGTDAASILKLENSRAQSNVWMQPAVDHLRHLGFAFIDLFVMNMEGYEYHLIPHLLYNRNIHITAFIVQFHFRDRMQKELAWTFQALIDKGYMSQKLAAGWELWQK